MSDTPISFFSEEIEFSLTHSDKISDWLQSICQSNEFELTALNYIFCDDEYLLEKNKHYLNHDYYTDIITFDNSDVAGTIEADIFISVDRVKENAETNTCSFENELHRVMAHGLLHLFGFADKTEEEQQIMRKKEDACLSLLKIN